MSDKKWILEHAIHKGTLMSRDIAIPSKHDSEEEALKQYNSHRDFYHNIGYKIWYAYLNDPEGNRTCLEQNSYIS